MEDIVTFGKMDFVMLGILLLASMAIGVFFAVSGNKQSTKVEYLLGGRNMGAIPVCFSLFATFSSAISLLGAPAEVYMHGTMILYFIMGYVLSYVVSIYTILPLMYPLKVTSIFEYLEMRFKSRLVRLLGAVIGMLTGFSYMTIALLSPALALQTVVRIPLWLSLIVVGGVGTIYTTIGGIRSVIWTDVFQTVIIFGGLIFVLIKGCIDLGGMQKVWDISQDSGRIILNEWSFDPRVRHTIWGLTFGATAYWLSVNFSQSSVQRLCSTKSYNDSRLILILSIPLSVAFWTILVIIGCVLVAYFNAARCDPLAAGYISNQNQLMPYFIMLNMSFLPGLSGIYMSSIFSGALSTLSSGINSLAAVAIEDILMPCLKGKPESVVTGITKALVCLFGVAIIGTAFLIKTVKGPVTQVTFAVLSATGGPVCGLFLLGGMFPQANAFGAGTGTLLSLTASVWYSFGRLFYGKPTPTLPSAAMDGCPSPNSTARAENATTGLDSLTSAFLGNSGSNWGEQHSTLWSSTETTVTPPTDDAFSIFDLSYVWTSLIGSLMTVIAGVLLSFLRDAVKGKTPHPHPELLFPFTRRLWRILSYQLTDDKEFDIDLDLTLEIGKRRFIID